VRIHPERNTGAVGPVPQQRKLLHPVRGARLPPDHLVSRPPRRDGALCGAHRGRSRALPGAALERQPHRAGGARGRPARRALERSVAQALVPVRAGRRQSALPPGRVHDALRARGTARDLGRAAERRPLRARAALAPARDGVGRAGCSASSTSSTCT
jgi:hypothetical protein